LIWNGLKSLYSNEVIRDFNENDLETARAIHAANNLHENCFPNLTITTHEGKEAPNALFITRAVYEHEGVPAIMAFLKATAEIFVLVNHEVGTPAERWEWMKEFNAYIRNEAWKHGLEQITCWIPPEIEESFAKRLIEMGYVKSPWSAYTLNLE
jgi:hypothetical protein